MVQKSKLFQNLTNNCLTHPFFAIEKFELTKKGFFAFKSSLIMEISLR